MANVRKSTPPAFRTASQVDPSDLPARLKRMQEYLLNQVEYDCRNFATAITEWKENELWRHFSDSWELFVAEHIKQPLDWIEHVVQGVELLDRTELVKKRSESGLHAALAELEAHADRIKADGGLAPANVWIDVYSVKGKDYARVRSDREISDGKKFIALGRVGSDRHREYKLRIERRNALAEIERRALMLRELIDLDLNQPIRAPSIDR